MDEEAVLRKKLETCEDFTERREIRRKLKEIRQKKLDSLDSEPSGQSSGRRHRKEEHIQEITTTSTDGVTVTEKRTTKTEILENGDMVNSEEKVEVSSRVEDVEDGVPDEAEPDPEPEPEPEANTESQRDAEPEEPMASQEGETQPQEEEPETVPPYMQKNPEDLTEQEIETIDDLDFLETTLNQLPIKFFDVRKYLRTRIRHVKVNQAKQRAESKHRGAASKQPSRVQEPQINIKDKSQLSALRQQIEHEKKEKQGGGISTTTTKTTEICNDGSGTSITKTTTTTTTRGASGGIGGRGGLRSFEAEMAKKKKERQAAKAQAFKSAKDKRNAFKDQLEASNPKPAGGVKKSFGQPNTAVNALLEWCRRKTRGYENVDVQNYTTSWADGLAMCALFHNFSPDLVPWGSLKPKDRKRNWTIAFDAAYAEGMDPLLELEDVLSTPVPEPRSLITYIHSIYQHFQEKAEKAKAEKASV